MTRAEPIHSLAGNGNSETRRPGTRCGQTLGDTYKLLEVIGTGGMAEVYAAEHIRIDRRFAVKILRLSEAPKAARRFRLEARAIARINSEFVVGVVDSGETDDGVPYLVMDLLEGEDLRSLLKREGPLPIPRAVRLVLEACLGVADVHRASLVHRDLKPENLYVARRANGEDWCKILDFGIAKTQVSESTVEGSLIGTVRYMAPEQLRDGASAGPQVDIYALGAVLYECLSGVSPYSGTSVQELMFNIMNGSATPLVNVPSALAAAIGRALAKSPAERFADVALFAKAIEPFSRNRRQHEQAADGATIDVENVYPLSTPVAPRSVAPFVLVAVVSAIAGFAVRELAHGQSFPAPQSSSTGIRSPMPATVTSSPGPAPLPTTVSAQSAQVTDTSPAPSAGRESPAVIAREARPKPRTPVAPPHARFDIENPYGEQ